MKTSLSQIWMPGVILASASLTSGFAQNTLPSTPANASPAPPAVAAVTLVNVAAHTHVPAIGSRLSPWSAEVLALAQAGIVEDVMRSFVDNCGMFNLNAEQIIQLDRAGVSPAVVTAMLQHDADVTAGVKVLTVTSRPKLDPAVENVLRAMRDVPDRTPPPPKPAAPAAAPEEEAAVPFETVAVEKSVVSETVAAVSPEKPAAPQPGPAYRVPETRPTEIVPPYLVINAASKTPNVIIIDLFPSSR